MDSIFIVNLKIVTFKMSTNFKIEILNPYWIEE